MLKEQEKYFSVSGFHHMTADEMVEKLGKLSRAVEHYKSERDFWQNRYTELENKYEKVVLKNKRRRHALKELNKAVLLSKKPWAWTGAGPDKKLPSVMKAKVSLNEIGPISPGTPMVIGKGSNPWASSALKTTSCFATLKKWYQVQSLNGQLTLAGTVYGHPRFPDGTFVHTSALQFFDREKAVAVTRNTTYFLEGEPHGETITL